MNILIVDDDEAILSTLRTLLEKRGHRVRATNAVLPAFEILRRGGIGVVLMDVDLPGLDGISFTRKLKTYPEFSGITIIAITGHHSEIVASSALRAGCSHYFQKPIHMRTLLKLLARLDKDSSGSEPVKARNGQPALTAA